MSSSTVFDVFDIGIAKDFGVPVQVYIEKIESVDENVRETILSKYFAENIKEAKELFEGI